MPGSNANSPMSETDIQNRIRISLAKIGARLFRRHVGTLYARDGTPIRVGVPGQADLDGWFPVTITPTMVGKTIAVYIAVEVKSEEGRLTKNQSQFLSIVNQAGGIGVMARSEQQALDLVQGR